jgi:hypothetical protein
MTKSTSKPLNIERIRYLMEAAATGRWRLRSHVSAMEYAVEDGGEATQLKSVLLEDAKEVDYILGFIESELYEELGIDEPEVVNEDNYVEYRKEYRNKWALMDAREDERRRKEVEAEARKKDDPDYLQGMLDSLQRHQTHVKEELKKAKLKARQKAA